ncbi:hypothetical protein BDZ97DRAFT_1824447 [Flammula alnicola]|nr:hypothetical protein BDZ97DRAFT_1824447 [Flammula alnicola]
MASQLRLILDDNAADFQYSGGQWTLSTLVQWYSGTSNYPAFVTSTVFGSFTLTFEGTSIAFIGNTPTAGFSQFAIVTIDGGTAVNTSYGTVTPPAYVQWYQSPTLPDGKHTITVGHLDGTAVDMAIITVAPNTPLSNKKVFVDNNDPAIQYDGSWIENKNSFNAGTLPDGFPVGNTTQRSVTPGDTMTFRFSGTSVAIYGIFSWTNLGIISATYTLDGNVQSQSYPVTASSPQHVSADAEASNFLFFSVDNIAAGNHTLVMNITEVENQTFILDYITYTPAFSTLATMPNLTGISTPTPGSSTTTTRSTATTLAQTASQQTASQGSQQEVATKKTTPVGAITGGVVGGLALLIFAILLLFWLRKRRAKGLTNSMEQVGTHNNNMSNGYPSPQMSEWPSPVRPNFGHSPSSSGNITPFPATNLGYSSMADLKRDRMDSDFTRTAPSPFSSDATSNTTSFDATQRGVSLTANTTEPLENLADSVPPAYDAISTHRPSTLSPLRR